MVRPLNSDEPAASCGLIFIPQTGSVTWSAVVLCNFPPRDRFQRMLNLRICSTFTAPARLLHRAYFMPPKKRFSYLL